MCHKGLLTRAGCVVWVGWVRHGVRCLLADKSDEQLFCFNCFLKLIRNTQAFNVICSFNCAGCLTKAWCVIRACSLWLVMSCGLAWQGIVCGAGLLRIHWKPFVFHSVSLTYKYNFAFQFIFGLRHGVL